MLPLHIFTLSLDSMPWITLIYPELRKLDIDWTWNVIEGVAAPENCTSWCAPQPPRLSNDGTTEYLDSLRFDPRVRIFRSEMWHGKIAMCNEPLKHIFEECLLMQMDSDEIWMAEKLRSLALWMSQSPKKNCAYFHCRYFVGPDIVISAGQNGYGNNDAYEWKRIWRINPGARWEKHEPPTLSNFEERPFSQKETEEATLTFDHFAWATEKQVEFKSKYYAGQNNPKAALYANAVEGWRRLQENQQWPIDLDKFLPWVGPGIKCERLPNGR